MPKLLAFSQPGYKGYSRKFSQTDRDLSLSGGDFEVQSILVMAGNWTLHSEIERRGKAISLTEDGGPDADGSYPDPDHWGGDAPFRVKFLQLTSIPPTENIPRPGSLSAPILGHPGFGY